MPSERGRSKEDTWTPEELNRALKRDDRRHRGDEDRKRDRHKEINGEDKHRRHRDEDSDRRRHKDDDRRSSRHRDEDEGESRRLTEDERERQRRERRERKEGKKDSKEIRYRGDHDEKPKDYEDDSRKRHKDEDDDREKRRRRDDDDRDKRRHHRDDDDRERRRHQRDDEEREKRRKEKDEEGYKSKGHRNLDLDRELKKYKLTEDDRERQRRERREKRDRKYGDKEHEKENRREEEKKRHDDKRDRKKDEDRTRDRDDRKHRSDRTRDRDGRSRQSDEEPEPSKSKSKPKKEEPEEDEYNYDDEEFEDYEEDFEEDEDDDDDGPVLPARGQGKDDNETIHKTPRAPGQVLDYSDSEVNDVLKALDEENERLLTESRRGDYQPQERSRYYSDDEKDKNSEEDVAPPPRTSKKSHTVINFVSAKQRAMSRKTATKTQQRGRDLLQMLELDVARFDLLDMPPVKEYDLYIRSFGRSDTRQAYVQTNDDDVDREIQTEEIDYRQKWTQHPPEDFKGSGRGDSEKDIEEEEQSQIKVNKEEDMSRLNKFLQRAGQVIAILLDEQKDEEGLEAGSKKSHISISEGYSQLAELPLFEGRYVEFAYLSPTQPNMLLTLYSKAQTVAEDNPASRRGMICVWNTNEPSYPQRILACESQPRCCCFSPAKPSLVFAGMADGSIAMWDLREPISLHRSVTVQNEDHLLRFPTYDTAGVLDNENHHSPVTSVLPVYSYITSSKSEASASEDTSSGLSFQLMSTEESATLHFWVVAEIQNPDPAGSENDLGLAPGGKVKLLKSSSIKLENPNRLQIGMKALHVQLLPSDPNQFYVGTDSGVVIHGLRFGKRAYPRSHSPVIESPVDVSSIDFSPFDQPCFLVGFVDGCVSLYHTKSENPLVSWSTITQGRPVQCVKWSRSRPCVFYVLDNSSHLYIYDLIENDGIPKQTETVSKERVISMECSTDHSASGLGMPGRIPQMVFCLESGKTEIHSVTKELREQQPLEKDYLKNYLARF